METVCFQIMFTQNWCSHLSWPNIIYCQLVALETLGNMGSRCVLSRNVCLTWFDKFTTKRDWAMSVSIVTSYCTPCRTFCKGGQVWIMSLFYFQRYFWFCDPFSNGTTRGVINLLNSIAQKLRYLWKERSYLKMENAILKNFEMSFK